MPKNIIHIGGKYTWEEVDELLNSNVKNKFKFTIGRNGQIALTTKVVTIKELMKSEMFDAESEKVHNRHRERGRLGGAPASRIARRH